MGYLKNLSENLKKGTKANFSLAIYSVVIAILAWFIISVTLYPSVKKTITNIPLTVEITGSAADSGLSVISYDVETVDVKLKCSRTEYTELTAETLTAYVDFENISTTGKKNLAVKLKTSTGATYSEATIEPATVNVVLDKYDTKEFPISPKIPNVTLAEGKTINNDEFVCEPDTISITGPLAQLEKISECHAVSDKDLTLDSSYTLNSDRVQLFSEDGSEIDQENMTFSQTNFLMNIPVLTQKTVTPTVQILNAPSDFDQSCLKLNMSVDSLTIASKNSMSEIPDTLEIAKIQLSDLDIGYSKTFDITSVLETRNCINMSGVDSITVSLDDTGLAKKELTLDKKNIHLSNTPADDYEYSILTQQLSITIVGPEDLIGELTANDFLADANLLNADTSLNQFNYDVSVSCLTQDNVWSVTKAKVSIQKTLKEGDSGTTTTTGESASTTTTSDN